MSSSLYSLFENFVDNNHKKPKNLKREIVDNIELLNFVNEIELLTKADSYTNNSRKYLKKDFPDENEKIGKKLLLFLYMKIILKFLK